MSFKDHQNSIAHRYLDLGGPFLQILISSFFIKKKKDLHENSQTNKEELNIMTLKNISKIVHMMNCIMYHES